MKRFVAPLMLGAGLLLAGCGGTPAAPQPGLSAPETTRTSPATLEIGTTLTGAIAGEPRDQDFYRFHGQAGDQLRIAVDALPGSTLDPYIFLYHTDGYTVLEKNDDKLGDKNRSKNSEILFNVVEDGDYLIRVSSFKLENEPDASDDLATNTYAISLTRR